MRQQPTSSLFGLWRRIPRVVAGTVAVMAELSPVRAVLALVMALGFGTSAAVAVASVSGPPRETAQEPILSQRPLSTASRDADRPDVGGPDAGTPQGSASAWGPSPDRPSHSPKARGDRTRPDKTRGPSPDPGASPSRSERAPATLSGPTSSPSGSETSGTSSDSGPPDTSVTARFPEGDSAVFSFSADEPASYICTLDGGQYISCDSPTSFSGLHPGWHVFAVRATDDAGNVDPTPAEVRWHADAGSSSEPGQP